MSNTNVDTRPVDGAFTIKEPHSIITKPIPHDATLEEMQRFVDEARSLCAELERAVIEAAVEHRTAELELMNTEGISGAAVDKAYDALNKFRINVDKLIAARKGDYE